MADREHIPRNVFIVAFVALASGFGQDLISPALPGFLLALGASRADIGLIDGLLNGTTAIFRLISGIASDHLKNRKSLIFIGYAISSVSRPLIAFAGSLPFVGVLRALDGAGKGTKDAPRDALIADSSAGIRGRAFGFHRLIDTAGSVFGPLAASAILLSFAPGLESYRFIFLLSAIPGIIALALILFGIREPERAVRKISREKLSFPTAFWIFLAGSTLAMLTRANDGLVLVRAVEAGIPSAWVPALFGAFTLLYALASYPIGIWSDRVGRTPFIIAGWATLALAEIGFALSKSQTTVIAVFILYGLFYALTEGSGRALIADLVPAETRGTAYALFHALTGLALILGGFGIGRIWDTISLQAAFSVSAAGSALSALALSALLLKPLRRKMP